jgi:Uma2 family endonuclease
MSTVAASKMQPTPGSGPRHWTREEYYRLADQGYFLGQRAERIGGQIVVQSPQKFAHFAAIDKAAATLHRALGSGFWVRAQAPLELGQSSDPEPDVSVVIGCREDYSSHTTTAVLIVEVSDTTIVYDRGDKSSLYAAAGIKDYWLIDLIGRQIEVFRDPVTDSARPFGAGYVHVEVFGPTDAITPLCVPTALVF